jgi:magnesium chelatase family protein
MISVMTARVFSATTVGFNGCLIEVECDVSNGLPTLQIVGLADKAIGEAKERVRSAIKNSDLEFPAKKITINLAPANLPKDGAHFDLPIALAILIVSGQLRPGDIKGKLFAGELALDGTVRPIKGAIHIAETAKHAQFKTIVLPPDNTAQANRSCFYTLKAKLPCRKCPKRLQNPYKGLITYF